MKLLELSLFYNNLSEMLNAGVGLTSLFESLSNSEKNTDTRARLLFVTENVKKGNNLALTLKRSGLVPVFDIPIIETGEKSGNLANVCEILSKNYQLSAQAAKNVRSGLMAPFFTFAGALFLPKFPDLFLEKITLTQYLLSSLSTLAVVVLIFYSLYNLFMQSYYNLEMAKLRHKILSALPILNKLAKNMALEKFCSSLALMLEAGLPIFEALKLAGQTSANEDITKASRRIINELKTGKPLPAAFKVESVFSDDIKNSILLGNESGKLPSFLNRSGQILKKQVNESVEKISKAIPVIIYWSVVLYVAWTIIGFYIGRIKMLNQLLEI